MKKVLFVVVCVLVAQLFLSSPASAQRANECINYVYCGAFSIWNTACVPAMPWNAFECLAIPYAFTSVCSIPSTDPKCAPPPPCHCGGGQPVSFANGNTWIAETDLNNPGLGGGLTLTRTWNSIWPSDESALQIGMFGPNWRSTYEESVFVGSDHYVKYVRADGSFWSLTYDPSTGAYPIVAPANGNATLIPGSSYWTLAFENGEKRLFDNTTGKLIDIIDRNGNTTQLSYDSLNRLTAVADPASQHLYFNYGPSSYLVSSVTTDFGTSLSYAYDSNGRLSQVTEPDSSTISFQYNSQSLITSVLDSNGKVLETHTYDISGRGLTSSKANGIDAVTFTYQ